MCLVGRVHFGPSNEATQLPLKLRNELDVCLESVGKHLFIKSNGDCVLTSNNFRLAYAAELN